MPYRIGIGQINTTVGDFSGNSERILEGTERLLSMGADLAVFPEMALTGYPPMDLLDLRGFQAEIRRSEEALVEKLRALLRGSSAGVVFGSLSETGVDGAKPLRNDAVWVSAQGLERRPKTLLPSYDVFDEGRWFEPARERRPLLHGRRRLGLAVCEDLWNDKQFWKRHLYPIDPVEELVAGGAEVVVGISASPFHAGKPALRRRLAAGLARRHRRPVVYVNLVGGNDSLVFDGGSFAVDAAGGLLGALKAFEEDFAVLDLEGKGGSEAEGGFPSDLETVRDALCLGLRDYLDKNGLRRRVVVGLSGGIDSSVVAALAVRALGREAVLGAALPSRYNSEASLNDARSVATTLGIDWKTLSIEPLFRSLLETVQPGEAPRLDLAEQNAQARLRGLLLMFLSNRGGPLVLSTGNKSELAMGYCTLYGDTNGGLSILGDLYKGEVYALGRLLNRDPALGAPIPEAVFTKPPTAELKPDQRDQDDLPPYPILDRILRFAIEENRTVEEMSAEGLDADLVRSVLRRLHRNEYKRRQAPPVLFVSPRAFGFGRRIPVAQRWDR